MPRKRGGKSAVKASVAILAVLRYIIARARVQIQNGRPAIGLAAVVAAAAVVLGRKQEDDKTQLKSHRMTSHPLLTWIVENSCILGVSLFSSRIFDMFHNPRASCSAGSLFLHLMPGHIMQVWGILAIQAFLTHYTYSDVPTFNGKHRPHSSLAYLVWDFVRSNLGQSVVSVATVSAAVALRGPQAFNQAVPAIDRIKPMIFLFKLAIMRACVDIGFYFGHRALHHRSLYWIHRYHHQHYRPTLDTNFHFSPLDVFIEAGFPVFLGLSTLEILGFKNSLLEASLLVGFIGWHEQGSHCGKPLPTVTYFPPLAPLYQLILGPVDKDNVRHHDIHHARLNCNYGITIWPDALMGTREQGASVN